VNDSYYNPYDNAPPPLATRFYGGSPVGEPYSTLPYNPYIYSNGNGSPYVSNNSLRPEYPSNTNDWYYLMPNSDVSVPRPFVR